MPVPMHMLTTPRFSLRRRRPWSSVATRIVLVAPSGRPAKGIGPGRVQVRLAHHRQRPGGEGFIELDPLDSGQPESRLAEHRRNRLHRTNAHHVR